MALHRGIAILLKVIHGTLIAWVVEDKGLSGLFVGDHLLAWNEAAELFAQRHIK
jgi:hypothetical protein